MIADVIPVLAAVTGLPTDAVEAAFAEAFAGTTAVEGSPTSRAFGEAVLLFRAAHPFDLSDLQVGMKAKEELDARGPGPSRPS